MNKTLGLFLAIIGGIVTVTLSFGAGLIFGRSNVFTNHFAANCYSGQANNGPFNSMMGGYGMMDGFNTEGRLDKNDTTPVTPMSIDQARNSVEGYLNNLNNPDLEIKEIIIFNNNAYARIVEKSTGIGAMELLVDHSTFSVYPEFGPTMMWNQKYGHMSGNGRIGSRGVMGGYFSNSLSTNSQMTVTPEDALTLAQQYLDQQYPGNKTATEADPFYGYYTIDILKDNEPAGMLSVNGIHGQVFLHTWHGSFVEMWE